MIGADLGHPPDSRPVIAVLDAKPGMSDQLALLIERLTPDVRAEPGCLVFMPYRSQVDTARYYIYEVYADAAAFGVHLQTDHVKRFIRDLNVVSTDGLSATVELDAVAAQTTQRTQGESR